MELIRTAKSSPKELKFDILSLRSFFCSQLLFMYVLPVDDVILFGVTFWFLDLQIFFEQKFSLKGFFLIRGC